MPRPVSPQPASEPRPPQPPTEVEREHARLYSIVHRGTPGDIPFYVAACEGVTRILELGCGAGRILEALGAQGLAPEGPRVLVGLDRHRGMLELASRAVPGARLVEADMTDFDLGERFERVLVPYNALFALPGPDAMADCLACARRHLTPGGEVFFDVYALTDEEAAGPFEDVEWEYLVTVLDGERAVEVWQREAGNGLPDSFDAHYRFELQSYPTRRVVHQRIRHSFVRARDLDALCTRAGLTIADRWGDFGGGPFTRESERVIVRALADP